MIEIRCEGLCKTYGNYRALDGVDLKVESGEIFGFLGPNGAGKTTTIRLLMGMLIPTAGKAAIHGLDCHIHRAEVKRFVGYLPDSPMFQDFLTGDEILRFVGEMHGFRGADLERRISKFLERFSIADAAREYAVNYSMGMKRKLALACAHIHDPRVFILDEPTNGLDPLAGREVQDWITAGAKSGKTIFLSTHLLDMADKLCHRVGIIHRGKLLAAGSPEELKGQWAPGGSLEDVFFAVTRSRED